MPLPTVSEGYLPFGESLRTFYRVDGALDGSAAALPVLALHGGPGSSLTSLAALAPLATGGRPLVRYDQVGGGRSAGCLPVEAFHLGLFLEQLESVRRELALTRVHLLGHSWGGALALAYLLGRPSGIASAVLVSPVASYPIFYSEFHRLLGELPPDERAALRDEPRSSPAYGRAWRTFQRRHYLRAPRASDRFPDWFPRAYFEPARRAAPREWDVTDRLDEIDLPVLLVSGRHDVVTPPQVELIADRLPRAEHLLCEHSAHFSFAEEPALFFREVGRFLDGVERGER